MRDIMRFFISILIAIVVFMCGLSVSLLIPPPSPPTIWAEYQDGVLIVIEDGGVIHRFEDIDTLKTDYIIFK